MAGRSLFGRRGDDEEGEDEPLPAPSEGVRLIDPDEAHRAVERGEVAKRRGGDTPRYGDRPTAPPPGPKPALRFPLPDSEDLDDIARPKAAPVPEHHDDDDIDQPPAAAERPARPEPPAPTPEPPVISIDPPSGEVELPHWTDPPTGEVPRVMVGEDTAADDDERWAAFAQGPRWRDEHEGWEQDVDHMAGLTAEDDEPAPMGALDTSERISHEGYLTFEDLEVPTAEQPRVRPGSPEDPIRIGGGGGGPRPAEPRGSGSARPRGEGRPPSGARPAGRRQSSRPERSGPRPPSSGEGGRRPPAPTDADDQPMGRDLPQAAVVGLGLAAVGLALFWAGPPFVLALVWVVVAACGVEYFAGLRQAGENPPTLLGLVAIAALPLAAYHRGEGAIPLVLFLLLSFGVLWYVLGVGGGHPIRNLGSTLLAVVHVGVLGSFAALLLRVGPVGDATEVDQGVSFLLLAVVAAVAYDLGGFFVGRRIGHTPLSAISPNKTREGLLAGMGAAVLAVLVLRFFPLFEVGSVLGFGGTLLFALCCAVAAPVGDLAESLVKRDLGIKDMGTVLPGHGGVLDRFDGMLFVLPTAFYVVRVLFFG